MSPRSTYEVLHASAAVFVAPRNIEEATERRSKLQGEIETLQAQLSNKDQRDPSGRRMSQSEFSSWRSRTIVLMNGKKQELRELKTWLAANSSSTSKPSEWALLARAHKIIERLAESGDEEAETLLDDIEFVVPGSFLQEKSARAG
jgi:flagellin-specific chaperone FliS